MYDFIELLSRSNHPQKAIVKLVIAANAHSYVDSPQVPTVIRRLLDRELVIDCYDDFEREILQTTSRNIVWLADNAGETILDLMLIGILADQRKHRITVGVKEIPYKIKVTKDDMAEVLRQSELSPLRKPMAQGRVKVMSTGTSVGTPLDKLSPEFATALKNADLVVAKGVDNYVTTLDLDKDRFYLLVSVSRDEILQHGASWVDGWELGHSRYIGAEGPVLAFIPKGTPMIIYETLLHAVLLRKKEEVVSEILKTVRKQFRDGVERRRSLWDRMPGRRQRDPLEALRSIVDRLCVDSDFRRRLFTNPDAALGEYQLSQAEIDFVKSAIVGRGRLFEDKKK